jgi:glycosyltransferase involved in cell wall biosynthesis
VAEALTPGKGVEALTNGVDTGLFRRVAAARTAPGVRYLVVPRRLYPKNGVETLVRALPRILEGSRGVEALIVGDGPERNRLEALSEELGVRGQIHFLGARPHTEMPGILSSAQLAVVPSLMEATSVAALESMACELPVVASDVGGLPEIVDETVGALVPPADPEALAAGVLALLNDPEREAKGARGRARVVEMWSNARLVERHLEIYEALLARGRGRR